MRGRIHKNCSHGLYWGQIYNDKRKEWENVTMSSITAWGCRRALQKWAKRHHKEVIIEN